MRIGFSFSMTAPLPLQLETVTGPKQARSERTLQRLLDAAESLINEKGHAAVSIPEIARRAGSSVGGFYARFRDKDELLRALEERHFIELDQRVEALVDARRWEHTSTAAMIDVAVAELVNITRERKQLIAAFLARAIVDPVIREGGLRFRRRVEQRLSALLLTRSEEFDHPEPALAIELGIQTAFALMQQHVLIEETRAGGRTLTDDELRCELARLFLRYIGAEERAPQPRRSPRRARRR